VSTGESEYVPHPIVQAAASGDLPEWAQAIEVRREHMIRVSHLLRGWAEQREETHQEVARWAALGFLHDMMRDAEPAVMRAMVDPTFASLSDKALHGPAAAVRLRECGVEDDELVHAVEYHTLGSRGFRDLGKALYAADFLEPGRKTEGKGQAGLRERLPFELGAVVREIAGARIEYLIERGRPIRVETADFWNSLV
jgi:2-amino-4-hydroxy-6-hydroxymethyldihydropteridine diphosphokinase